MRKNAKYILVSLLSFCFAVNVNAAECSYEKQVELNNLAATVKATYEAVDIDSGYTVYDVNPETGEVDPTKEVPFYQKGFKVKVLNLTDELSITINNDTTGESKTYFYSDTENGTITLDAKVADQTYSYTMSIHASSGCEYESDLRSLNLITPMYNDFYGMGYCKENPDFEYCQEYIGSPLGISLNEFYEAADKYDAKKDQTKKETKENKSFISKIKEFFESNKKLVIIVVSIVIILGVATTAIIIVKRRSRMV